MTDIHSKEVRSFNMSRIRSKDTKPEMLVRRFLHKNGFRYRLYIKNLAGRPDIVLPKYKTIVLIHGCFWHGHDNCKFYRVPKSNTDWWQSKIKNNITRDGTNLEILQNAGWKVIVLWECELLNKIKDITLKKLIDKLST